ncbi:MAG: endonuclease, partial [Myxococcota bacterium]
MYSDSPRTFYCDCRYDPRRMEADATCGYQRQRGRPRVNWEHVVPASHLGNHRPSWKGDDPKCRNARGGPLYGRSCARAIDPQFNLREADLYNLYPSLMDLNRARGSLRPGMVSGEERKFGKCDFEVGRLVEPASDRRGDFARVYAYMAAAYPDADFLRPSMRRMMQGWSKADPVDAAECRRAFAIEQIQGNQ